ncbi:Cytochrome c oxidase polypeptide II [Rhodovulum sp. PH10]|uniref:cytochrome c oxidase subunit II n=1 Tax=Rhodovulum sp. PH10 TaxID=1187851 RepID=UPI00027C2AFE|nr:cytochrome c oxidase subunit II [Rhodovulum sp. PH10]EJW12527.1 Cytochrome c oxidase polypeptide II [Rhodovulum sp. PH10]
MSMFMPIEASDRAAQIDTIFLALLIISLLISALVFGLIIGFGIRYRRASSADRGPMPEFFRREFEIGWTFATALLFLFLFWWAASVNIEVLVPPKDSYRVNVVAKQWMWKFQYPNGVRQIDTLRVPIDTPITLTLESQDVIHSFFVPAFRIKQDVVPGLRTETWFKATKLGTFKLLCAEYCGTDHSRMRGEVIVMRQKDFAEWLAARPEGDDLARRGAELFVSRGCSGCHAESSNVHAPRFPGLYGRRIPLADGRTAVADEAYIRDSMLQPNRDVAAGYRPIMPSYSGLLDDGEIESLTAYIRSLGTVGGAPAAPTAPPSGGAANAAEAAEAADPAGPTTRPTGGGR